MKSNLNILLISHDFSVAGAPNSLLRQAKYFKRFGHNVDVWTMGGGNLECTYRDAGFIPVHIKNNKIYIKDFFEKQNNKYDFILCNTTETYKCVDVLQRYGIPLVWFIRETHLVDENMRNNPNFAKVFNRFYNLYTVSEYALQVSKKYNTNVRFINNAIEDRFKQFTEKKESTRFGFIGTISKEKGIDTLIEAYKKLLKKNKNIELYIAGNIKHYHVKEWLDLTKEIHSIKWLGELEHNDKQVFFENIDVLCVPSLDDPCPLTVIEGAMYGKALITSENTGSNFVVERDKNGFIVKTGDLQSLVDAMDAMIFGDMEPMMKHSRQLYETYASPEREEKEVMQMLTDNLSNYPVVHTTLSLENSSSLIFFSLLKFFISLIPIRQYRKKLQDKIKIVLQIK